MKVSELIAALQGMPQDAPVRLHWDGASRSAADFAWLAQGGHVSIGDYSQSVYSDRDRVEGAPSRAANAYLNVTDMLGYDYDIVDDPDTFEEVPVFRKKVGAE